MKPVQEFVLVGGWPGSGKTTLSQALAAEFGIDCLSKDDFKEMAAKPDSGMSRMAAANAVRHGRLLIRAVGRCFGRA